MHVLYHMHKVHLVKNVPYSGHGNHELDNETLGTKQDISNQFLIEETRCLTRLQLDIQKVDEVIYFRP